uniref:Uncharacterized protein n=1 Tax=Strigamia maritima TaxID=126957 RepID=T1IWH9_STRMM
MLARFPRHILIYGERLHHKKTDAGELFNTKIKIKRQDRNILANDCSHDNVHYELNEDKININNNILRKYLKYKCILVTNCQSAISICQSDQGTIPYAYFSKTYFDLWCNNRMPVRIVIGRSILKSRYEDKTGIFVQMTAITIIIIVKK